MVNCTCTTLSTHAVLTDLTPLPYVRESTAVEEMSTWFGLVASIWLLALALLGVSLVGSKSILSSVYYNQIMCLFLAQILYCVGLKAAVRLASHQVGCKLVAISLHYLWLSSLCWWMLSSVHLLRMLASVRDVNRGPMIHYYTLSYAGPGIVVALAVAIRPHHYGNFYFCWISLYESAIWSMLGPGFLIIVVNLIAMFLALRAAFIVNHTIASYGNVRLLVWLNVGGLPLTVGAWLVSLMVASEHSTLATVALSAVLPAHSLLLFLTVVSCLDPTLRRMALRLISSKVPPAAQEDSSSPVRPTPTARSSMTYRAAATGSTTGGDPSKRHIGISNASTTSRSTTKTSSSPYRSDNQLRNTSTSSNYEHASSDNRRVHHASDSDSEEGDGRSLELASSHSSDEESTVTRRRPERPESRHIDPPASYDTLVASGALDALNIAYNVYQTRPAPPLYTNIEEPPGAQRWTRSTISDNEVAATSTARHELSKISNLYGGEEEKTLNDKYLFPYTAEEDHSLCGGPSALRGSAERLDNSPSPLAMHHHQFLSQDSEKSTSETPV